MNININNLPLPVTSKLTDIIKDALKANDITGKTFRDPDYSTENGGYHPVEIMLKRHCDEWHFQYITDFCYVGMGAYAELVKDLDFDFWERSGGEFCCYFTARSFNIEGCWKSLSREWY